VNTTSRAEFDQYARDYLQELSHPLRNIIDPQGHYFIEIKSRILEDLVAKALDGRTDSNLVDVGTGLGLFEKYLNPTFKNIFAVDLSFEMLKVAKVINPFDSPNSAYVQGNAYELPLENDHADLLFMSCVLHHMADDEILSAVTELVRVCRPGGFIVFFEHNPLNLFTQLVVKTTPLDNNARLIRCKKLEQSAKQAGLNIHHREFFLYGTRGIDNFFYKYLPWLGKLPFGGQYALIGQKKS
jgi:ubiquinone/menaquinone biosynthesis C-methylase UbiE